MMPTSSPANETPAKQERPTPAPVKKLSRGILFKRSDYFVEDNVDFRSGSQKRSGLKLVLWSWMSTLIDTMILVSISCFCMILFSFLMKTPARDVVKFVSVEPNITKMFLFSFLFSFWAYLVVMRIFMGASLGEWSCQLRVGQPSQRINATYAFRVIGRTTLILLTGVVVMPLLSLVFERDIAGEISGIKIYSLT